MASHAAFERNRARLARRHPELAAALGAADDARVEVVEGRHGTRTLAQDGVRLASAYDPRGEGARLAQRMADEPADLLVAVGFGLGHHLEQYRAAHPVPMLIYEPSPARLRAALALRAELGWVGDEDVHWARTPLELADRFAELYGAGLRVRAFVHPATQRLAPHAVGEALRRLARSKDAHDSNAATWAAIGTGQAALTAENLPHLLRVPNAARLTGRFEGVPAVIAAAGPSLNRQLPALRAVADRVLVIAIGQTLPVLRDAGIEPDLVHVVESQDVAHQLTRAGDPGNLILATLPSVHPAVLDVAVRARFLAVPVTNPFGRWISAALGEPRVLGGGATVAQSAVLLAAAFGASPILLIGQDLAFTGGQVYARGTAYDMVSYETTEDGGFRYSGWREKSALFGRRHGTEQREPRQDLVWVEGWDGERVASCKAYAAFIEHYRLVAWLVQASGSRLVNCTEGGARIPGVEHARFAEMLEQVPAAPAEARRRLLELHDAAPPADPRTLVEPLAGARQALEAVEREARAGLVRARRAPERLHRASAQRSIRILREVARAERRVRRALARVPWLDAFVPGEAIELAARARRSARGTPEAEAALGDSVRLFETTLQGVERARLPLERLTLRLEDALAAAPRTGRPRLGSGAEARP